MAVNVKMGVDLGNFKSNVREAQNEIKTLNANMELVEATFEATGNAEQAMSNKLTTLNTKLTAQKKIISEYEKALKTMTAAGVDPASASYQKMAQEMLKAQTDMVRTQTQITELGNSAKDASKGTDKLSESVDSIGKKMSLEQVISGVSKISDGMEKAARHAVKLGKAVANEVLGAGSWADELSTTAKAYGISTDELQRMQKTAQIIDTDVDAILQARQKLGKNAGNVEELFGFSTSGMTIEDAFWKTGEAIMSMTDAFEQEEAAQKVFGKSWRELVPMFEAGREEYERINSTWNTVSDEQLKSLTEMDDKYQTLKADLETLKMETLSQLAEPMSNLMTALSDMVGSEKGQAAINTALGAAKDTLQWIADNKENVVSAIGAIGAAFAGLKVSETVLTFMKLASGIKDLFGAGNAAAGASSAASGVASAAGTAGLKAGLTAAGGASALFPLGIFGLGIAPGVYAQMEAYAKWNSDYMRRMESASGAGINELFIRNAAEALGADGQVDFGAVSSLLMGLQSRKNQQKAELYNMLNGSTTAGNNTWNLLNSFWEGAELDSGVVNELIQNITDIFASSSDKALMPVDVVLPDNVTELISAQIGTVPVHASISIIEDGEHANGLWSVPYDGYLARLHRGERIMPAREVTSRNYNSNLYIENMHMGSGIDAQGLADKIVAAQRRQASGYGN